MFYLGSGLRFHFKAEAEADDSFNLLSFDFDEQLSSPFKGELILLSRRDDITAEQIVDKNGVLSIWQDGVRVRSFHGIVSRFAKEDSGHKQTQYKLTMEPAMARLRLRQNSRIFQEKSLKQIFSTLLDEMGISDYAFSWDARYESEKREYCVQYRESDFDFITRLAAEAGVFWYFEFSDDKHTLIFCDATSKLPAAKQLFPYNALSGGDSEVPFVRSFSYAKQLASAKAELKDYSFKKPAYSFLQDDIANQLDFQQAGSEVLYEHYDYPGRYKDDAQGELFTRARLQALRNETQMASAMSDIADAGAGIKFNLGEHPDAAFNRDWLLVGVKHSGIQGAAAEEGNSSTPTQYQNQLLAIEGHLPWLSLPATKPLVTGPHMAIVVGPDNEEIFCDEFGRVKVQFPWDRYGRADEHSSCWVRVSQGWAGGQYGFMAVPRIGHEVIVSFLEGDPDQPIITGRTYHAANPVPYVLPTNKTKTVLKTQTHKGPGFNELSFEDAAENQLIYLHAQKDHKLEINHDQHYQVGNDREKHIGRDQRLNVGQDEFLEIGRDQQALIGQDQKLEVTRDRQTLIKRHYRLEVMDRRHEYSRANHDLEVGGHYTHKVEGKVLLEAGESVLVHTKSLTLNGSEKVTIQGPGGKILIDSGGITLEAPNIKLKGPVAVTTGAKPQLATLKSAAEEGNPIVDLCPDCGE
ncbi:type VI secretion system Vgr family protein [Shewanella sp. Iso12]|uniref:type VI secretion system Vgr family protein n=1 Tax=Shewanella sp. Iso12 TaxID=1826753 RepID=UPI0014310972|nr:type VI secretion system tip protein TssI/VgrG [Shewanella sp. Iso12]NJI83162.1 type VI secretion system tip protein VgrG [Shewanella sp. Iso12]